MLSISVDSSVLFNSKTSLCRSASLFLRSSNRTVLPSEHLGSIANRAARHSSPPTSTSWQIVLLRRYINSILLSREELKEAFLILDVHYEMVYSYRRQTDDPFLKIVYRVMGAKIGQCIYWPGSGMYCPDPELLDIWDDLFFFGSRSLLINYRHTGK